MKQYIHHIQTKIPLIVRVVSLYIVLGVSVSFFDYVPQPAFAEQVVSTNVSKSTPIPAAPQKVSGHPVRIELPRIGLVREVIDGDYDMTTKVWTLTDDKAQYATMTAPINNQTGQTVIYGHNTVAVLEPVKLVEPGDELVVETDSKHKFVYVYGGDRIVNPVDTSVLYETSDAPRLVLMTCEGVWSDTRRLLYFDFKEVRS